MKFEKVQADLWNNVIDTIQVSIWDRYTITSYLINNLEYVTDMMYTGDWR